jgi:ABC-type amino acid transport substrate-binding protein
MEYGTDPMFKHILSKTLFLLVATSVSAGAQDLVDIKKQGTLRHLGIPYANFVTGAGDGFSVDIAKGFAAHLGVDYEFVESDWPTIIQDLVGREVTPKGSEVEFGSEKPIRGDIIANGLTIVPWREKAIRYSSPTFPTQVWLVTRSDSTLKPVAPGDSLEKDITTVRGLLQGQSVLGKANTCLDPSLYDIAATGAEPRMFDGALNDMAGVVMQGEIGATLLDVPDALVALRRWPGKIKIIGPLSPMQGMAVGFNPNAPLLRAEFEKYFEKIKRDGTYWTIIEKYYPLVLAYFPDFFKDAARPE